MSQCLVFDQFEIRLSERVLVVAGARAPIGSRAFDVLLALAERRERVVSKAELLDIAWPGLVVEENNLTVQISALRRLLGHDAIATVTGRGYRLSAALSGEGATAAVPVLQHAEPARRLVRRLCAIVQAEVVGWPRLVARDPQRAAISWKRVREELVEATSARFSGRLIELTAERVLLEFGSAVDAVAWCIELQAGLEERRLAAAPDESTSLHMRMGIAVDDLIDDEGKLVGEGVSLAADLQYSAGHDEVLATQAVVDLVAHKVEAEMFALGERVMRRLQRPVQVYRLGSATTETSTTSGRVVGVSASPHMASLAVLPFHGEADDDSVSTFFQDGFTEEIIAALSLNRALFVIAHSSTIRYRAFTGDLLDVSRELGVRYLVTGRVRRSGELVRVRVELLAATDQRVLWQRRFDGGDDDLFTIQSDISAQVAAAIAPQVQDEEVARIRQRPTTSYGAYEYVLRALAGIYQLGTAEFDNAGAMLQRAIELDPAYAQAHAHLAWWYSLRQFDGNAGGDDAQGSLALEHAMQAMRLDGQDAWVLSVAGYMLTLKEKRLDQAMDLFDQAIALNPSCAAAWARSAATLSYMGRCDASIERVDRAMRLSPFDQHMFWHHTIRGGACFVGGRYDEAMGWLGKALRLNPCFNGARRMQIAALVRCGELAEARELGQALMLDCPNFSVTELGRWSPMRQPHLDDVLQALRQAGLPG